MLSYREIAPPAALAPFVRCFWTLRGRADEVPRQRILPDGSPEIVFHFGDPFLQNDDAQPRAMFVGEISRPVVVSGSGRADVFGIRFRIGGAAPFLSMPMGAVAGHVVELDDLLPGISPAVMEARNTQQRSSIVETALTRRMGDTDRRLNAVIREITSSRGRLRIREVAARVGATERTIERLFDRGVGMRPKMLARLARFQAAIRGDDSGYFDDSHRIHDFHEFAGVTPAQLAREQNDMNDHFVGNLQDGRDEHR